jgi:hypothetical protein
MYRIFNVLTSIKITRYKNNMLARNYEVRQGEKSIREGETWSAEHCSGNKTVPTRVAAACRENGHRQDAQTGTAV